MRVVFWNVNGRRLDAHVAALAADSGADVVVLIEPPDDPGRLASLVGRGYARIPRTDRFLILSRPPIGWAPLPYPDPLGGVEFFRVSPPAADSWVFAVVHAPDRRNVPDDDTRALFFRQATAHLARLEGGTRPRRTVVFGDLNANPFEPSVMGANGLHALGVAGVRGRTSRPVRRAGRREFFYNPMWRLYGAGAADAGAATYFHRRGDGATEPLWHMLDQVLVRPEVADRLPAGRLRILTAAGAAALVDPDGRPAAETASDHLPVAFELL